MSQGPLSRLLQTWAHTPPPAPGFRREVWMRVAERQRASWPSRLALFTELHRWLMPASFAALVALGLAAGVVTGLQAGRSAEQDRLAQAFAASTDPFLMIAANTPAPGHNHR